MEIGFTSVTFREKSPEECIRLAKQAKLTGIEWGGDIHLPPGNLKLAEQIAEKMEKEGLRVLSYGSYYRTEIVNPQEFLSILDTAKALGAPIIRIWAGTKSPKEADLKYRAQVAACAKRIATLAKHYGITVAFEYHRGTLTENAQSALDLLKQADSDNLKLYWQPNPDISRQENGRELTQLLPYLACVHIFHWTQGDQRHLLKEGAEDWKRYFVRIHEKQKVNFILEFCRDDDPNAFLDDCRELRRLLLPQSIFLSSKGAQDNISRIFPQEVRQKLLSETELDDNVYFPEDFSKNRKELSGVEYIFSTWGMPSLTREQIVKYLPRLKGVFYAAGSVQGFARPFLEAGIKVYSAWGANAVPVAEYTVAQILLANKGFFRSCGLFREKGREKAGKYAHTFPGNYHTKVGILGAGMIGSMVCRKLQEYCLEVLVYDPFLTKEDIENMGGKKASLEEIFSQCQVISNHVANLPRTVRMLTYRLFSKMKENAVFLNTGRGAQVIEEDLVLALKECPDRTAVLDVTDPEPPLEGHPFYELPNVILTPHIAGSSGNEVERMGEYMVSEFLKKRHGETCAYEVTLNMLDTMA